MVQFLFLRKTLQFRTYQSTIEELYSTDLFNSVVDKLKRFPKELDTVSKIWKHLETFGNIETFLEKEGVSKMD